VSSQGDLEALYPLLRHKTQETAQRDPALPYSIQEKLRDSRETNARSFAKTTEMGIVTVALAGSDAGKMKTGGVVGHCPIMPMTSIHRIQECHVAAYHILWGVVHAPLADDRGSTAAREATA
jgi:hypothetical protein